VHAEDATIPISTNLGDAMDIVLPFVHQRELMFWVDSICINQEDIDERSRRVRFMNTIYRSVELVAIWLGQAADESELAFDMMRDWEKRYNTYHKLGVN
jgi:hypothetical protein